MKIFEKIKNKISKRKLEKREIYTFLVFFILSIIFAVATNYFEDYFNKITIVLFVIELVTITLFAYYFAGRAVMKSLFIIGAELTLMIYLAQAYCDIVPLDARTADEALKSLIYLGLLYLVAKFVFILYKEVIGSTKLLRKINDNKNTWILTVPFALFVGLIVGQIWQVVSLIVKNLCIYK